MPIRIALMRSIVIDGRRVKGEEARGLAGAAGATDVRSVGATGNLLFRSRKAPATLERDLEAACARLYGRPTEIVVKTAAEWRALLKANPFPDRTTTSPARVLVWAMRDPLPDQGLDQLRRRASAEEEVVRTRTGDIYMWFGGADPNASKLPSGFGLKALGAVGTNRNWNTVTKITAVLDGMEAP
ncbi:DUF1697 domain-containing protein [Brevundimonas sp.]|uniref:DUF1697 domain-containing protein n=1 Tax=Brevundimonas sp. TaxID=1871086 RepID=UPI0027378CE7|nr:DUF1697 domain-containing protein [Brevundimonas sp.]MDP3802081.1 DUF1697 domain-containing protein [Brevundimonas sp.]